MVAWRNSKPDRGFTQKYSIDYTETFSPKVKMTTVRSLIVVAIKKTLVVFPIGCKQCIFTWRSIWRSLHEKATKTWYWSSEFGLQIKKKSLYGLKQASRQWHYKLLEALKGRGYQNYKNDYSLFLKKAKGKNVFLVVYVDDILMTGDDLDEMEKLTILFSIKRPKGKMCFLQCM